MARRGMSEEEVLALRPVRLAEWSESESESGTETGSGTGEATGERPAAEEARAAGGPPEATAEASARVTLQRPLPPVRGVRSLFARISALTGARRLRLDEPGSFLWRQMDGERTAEELAAALREAFGEAVEPAGERVGRFLYNLDREQLIELRDGSGAQVKLARL